jgi:hypothetical protein
MSLAGVGIALRERLDDVSERMALRLRAEVESYSNGSMVPFESLLESCERNVRHMVAHYVSGEVDVRTSQLTGRIRAEQGVPLADMLHAYRLGFEFLWSEVLEEARTHPEVTNADLVAGSADTWALFGRYAEAMAATHREATVELSLQHAARRSALAEALITGAIACQATLSDTARELGLPDRGPYAVVVAAAAIPGAEPLPGIEATLHEARIPSAWRLRPDQRIGLVSLAHPDAERTSLSALRSHRARVGVSPPFDELRDAPRALRFAGLALDGVPGDATGVALFDDNPLTMLIAAAPEEAKRLVKVTLGAILELPGHERLRLLETLEHWFAAGGSAAETAQRLFVHANTVRYRLRQVEELTGRCLTDPAALVDLGAALHAARMQGQCRGVDHS